MDKEELELYIHIPFCIKKCQYCDFLSFTAAEDQKQAYIRSLVREIEGYEEGGKQKVITIFFGGGTPSIVKAEEIGEIMKAVREKFTVASDAEITLEANPGTLTPEKLNSYRKSGINRLSIGLQSAQNKELELLGRIHTWEAFRESFSYAREAGFQNINIDLMSALPGQTSETWRNTLESVLQLSPEHISAYSLILEEGTPFYERYGEDVKRREAGKVCRYLPSEEEERQMYYDTAYFLRKAGYQRYEISNYAKRGYECRHNTGYWRRRNYLGLGLGASSLMGKERYCNTRDMELYLKGSKGTVEREKLTKKDEMEEFMFLGLRLCKGISTEDFRHHFGIAYEQVYGVCTEKLIKEGMLERKGEWLSLTSTGMDISNHVMVKFLLD